MVQVLGFKQEDPAQLLFRLGIRAIGDGHLAILPSQGGGVSSALERFSANKMTVLPKHVVIGEALVDQGVALAFGHCFPLFLFQIPKAYVFHDFPPGPTYWLLAPIVVCRGAKSTTAFHLSPILVVVVFHQYD